MSRLTWFAIALLISIFVAGSAAAWILSRDGEIELTTPARNEDAVKFCSYALQTNAAQVMTKAMEPQLEEETLGGTASLVTSFWESAVAAAPSEVHEDAATVLDGVRQALEGSDPHQNHVAAAERVDRWIADECPALEVDPGVDPPK